MATRLVNSVRALSLLAALAGCDGAGDGAPAPKSSLGDDGGDEPIDAGTVRDGGDDGAVRSESSVAPSPDACRVTDAGVVVVSADAIDPSRGLAVSSGDEGALLSWVAYREGKARLVQQLLTADETRLEVALEGAASNQTSPTSTRTASGYLTVWSDDARGGPGLAARTLSADGAPDAAQLSLGDDAGGLRPAAATAADGAVFIAYVAEDGARGVLIDADGAAGPSRALPSSVQPLGALGLAALGGGFVLAYASADDGHVYLLKLDAAGDPAGEPVRLDADGFARGNVVIATSQEGGVVAYDVLLGGVWGEVRLRTFDKDGAPTLSERVATVYPEQGAMPAIRPLNGGYALLFRRSSEDAHTITLRLVDTECAPIADMHLLPIESVGLPLALDVSPDGTRMLVGFIDALEDAPSYVLRRAWVVCDG